MDARNRTTLNVMLTMIIAFANVEILFRSTNRKYGGGGVGGGNCARRGLKPPPHRSDLETRDTRT